jgi:multidrug resistance efflux pump
MLIVDTSGAAEPTAAEELQAQHDILTATVLILQEEAETARAAAQEEALRLRGEVDRLNRLIYSGTIGPEDRSRARNDLR